MIYSKNKHAMINVYVSESTKFWWHCWIKLRLHIKKEETNLITGLFWWLYLLNRKKEATWLHMIKIFQNKYKYNRFFVPLINVSIPWIVPLSIWVPMIVQKRQYQTTLKLPWIGWIYMIWNVGTWFHKKTPILKSKSTLLWLKG